MAPITGSLQIESENDITRSRRGDQRRAWIREEDRKEISIPCVFGPAVDEGCRSRWGVVPCQPQRPLTMTSRNAKGDETVARRSTRAWPRQPSPLALLSKPQSHPEHPFYVSTHKQRTSNVRSFVRSRVAVASHGRVQRPRGRLREERVWGRWWRRKRERRVEKLVGQVLGFERGGLPPPLSLIWRQSGSD